MVVGGGRGWEQQKRSSSPTGSAVDDRSLLSVTPSPLSVALLSSVKPSPSLSSLTSSSVAPLHCRCPLRCRDVVVWRAVTIVVVVDVTLRCVVAEIVEVVVVSCARGGELQG